TPTIPRTEPAMPFSHPTPTACHWFSHVAAALDRRSAVRLTWVFVGAVLARGRRTVTSWIRAAGLSADYKPVYTAVAAAGARADRIAARLARAVVRPLLAGPARLTLALDDTPTKRYGPQVQGAGIHHNPTPGPAGRPRVYGDARIDLAKRAGQRRGWERDTLTLYGQAVVKRYKTFVATWRPAGGAIRVVLVDEPAGWRAYFCTDLAARVADILAAVA